MSLNVYETSAGVFIHGLTNLKRLLTKTEAHIVANRIDEPALLEAQLAAEGRARGVAPHRRHVASHLYAPAISVAKRL